MTFVLSSDFIQVALEIVIYDIIELELHEQLLSIRYAKAFWSVFSLFGSENWEDQLNQQPAFQTLKYLDTTCT